MLATIASGSAPYSLAFWTTDPCLVVPRSYRRNPLYPSAARSSASEGWPVVERGSGGDVTPQGSGILNVSFALRTDQSVEAIYRMLCDPIRSLADPTLLPTRCGEVAGAFCDGRFNVVASGRKLAGTAQRWRALSAGTRRRAVLAHALILIDADLDASVGAINRFRQNCGLEPNAKARSHLNLRELIRLPAGARGMNQAVHQLQPRYEFALDAATQAAKAS